MECENCGYEIDLRTDDNYDKTHDNCQCPRCHHWQSTWRPETRYLGGTVYGGTWVQDSKN